MDIIKWLLEGDVSIQYQVYRDLLDKEKPNLRERIIKEGFGKQLLDNQQEDGHWGGGYYHYKWINTHYTLLELRRLEAPTTKSMIDVMYDILDKKKTDDGGIQANPRDWDFSDVCMNGMMMNVMCYYQIDIKELKSIIDFVITQQVDDGGFNCFYNDPRYPVWHSSLHSTVSMIEGFNSYINYGYTYRVEEIRKLRDDAIEFILEHRMYKSDKTGEVIDKNFIMLSYPPRYRYDILRAFEAFKDAGTVYDERMSDAFEIIKKKRRKDGTWPVQHKHAGREHFVMDKRGGASRWNTLRVLRVYKHFFGEYK